MIYFTADPHFFHESIITFCHRPCGDIEEMHELLIDNHNAIVKKEDTVYFVGDMTAPEFKTRKLYKYFPQIVRKLNGTKHLILGNHDEWGPFKYVNVGFSSVHTAFWFKHITEVMGTVEFVLAHDPSVAEVLTSPKQVLLCGHIHNLFRSHKRMSKGLPTVINVGVDVNEYRPISLDEIIEELEEEYLENIHGNMP